MAILFNAFTLSVRWDNSDGIKAAVALSIVFHVWFIVKVCSVSISNTYTDTTCTTCTHHTGTLVPHTGTLVHHICTLVHHICAHHTSYLRKNLFDVTLCSFPFCRLC